MDIEQFLFATLNGDATLAALWGTPAENPYLIEGPAGKKFPYTIYRLIQNPTDPNLEDPTGAVNTWVYSFTTWSLDSAQITQINNRISALLLLEAPQPGGFQGGWQVSRIHLYDNEEQAYGIAMDLMLLETIC